MQQIPEAVHPYVPLSVFVLHNTTKTERLKPHVSLTHITHSKYERNVKYASKRAKIEGLNENEDERKVKRELKILG